MIIGYFTGKLWLFRVVAWLWLIVTALDLVVTPGGNNVQGTNPGPSSRNLPWRLGAYLWVPVQATIIICGLFITSWDSLTLRELLFVTVSIGIASGMFCVSAAHELMHGSARLDKILAEILMTLVSYTHFCIEHVHGHHRNVATAGDPATAQLGESFYAFYPRTVFCGVLSAWNIETERLQRCGAPVWSWRNQMVRYMTGLILVYAVIGYVFGPVGLGFFAVQSLIGFSMLEVINYVEHYGLARRQLAPGVYERVMPWHSWNSSHRLSNWLLFNLGRHSDHHCHARRSYFDLRHLEEAPQLPSGYFGMFLLPLFPRLWRRLMDPRVEAWRRKHGIPVDAISVRW